MKRAKTVDDTACTFCGKSTEPLTEGLCSYCLRMKRQYEKYRISPETLPRTAGRACPNCGTHVP